MDRKLAAYPIIYGWDIMLNKKLVDIYYLIMMLIYIRRRMEGWTIPVRCFVPFESPRTRVPVLCFLMIVPNRVWGAMGPPCLTYLASYILVVARADLYLQRVCVGSYPSCFRNTPGQRRHNFSRWSTLGELGPP